MIDRGHALPLVAQARQLGISRGSIYYLSRPVSDSDLAITIVDWFTRRVLAWRVSVSLDAGFSIQALEEALARYGKPAIFNSDQGSQFTSTAFAAVLLREKIAIGMDGKSC